MSDETPQTPIIKENDKEAAFEQTPIPALPEGLDLKEAKYLSLITRLELQAVGTHYTPNDKAVKVAFVIALRDFIGKAEQQELIDANAEKNK
jgi:hypothetical protein